MEEIGRFFENLFSGIIYQIRYRAERKVRDTVDQQLDQLQRPKKKEQAEEDRE